MYRKIINIRKVVTFMTSLRHPNLSYLKWIKGLGKLNSIEVIFLELNALLYAVLGNYNGNRKADSLI